MSAPSKAAGKAQQVSREVLEVLSRSTVEGLILRLPAGQLERKLYEAVNKVLEACGGQWNRKAKAHVFSIDPEALIADICNTGVIMLAPDLGWFPTPPAVVAMLMERADGQPGMTLLEPSAGEGAIVGAALALGYKVTALELDPGRWRTLSVRHGADAAVSSVGDFLQFDPIARFDRVVMNPPFAKQADIAHVRHAHRWLAPKGRLVSVMGAGVSFRGDRKATEFRAWLDDLGGTMEPLPDGSFIASGTGVSTVVVTIPAVQS